VRRLLHHRAARLAPGADGIGEARAAVFVLRRPGLTLSTAPAGRYACGEMSASSSLRLMWDVPRPCMVIPMAAKGSAGSTGVKQPRWC